LQLFRLDESWVTESFRKEPSVAFRIPRWVFTSLLTIAIICAAAAGYQSDRRRLRASQDQESGLLSKALNNALQTTATLQRQSVRPPRTSSDLDTLEFYLSQAVILTPGVPLPQSDLYADSLCTKPLARHQGRSPAELAAGPLRLWVLNRVRLYVDKTRGGLWRSGDGQAPELVAARVEKLAVELDRSGDHESGLLLELTGSLNVGSVSPIRRKLYRYLPAAEMSRG
jgi:hypothetical protein